MTDTVIVAEGLGKRYSLTQQVSSESLGRSVARLAHRLIGAAAADTLSQPPDFWALQDVSFQVNRSDVLGIIGHNGSGKSTLLKILSRIVWPTTGRAWLNGKVSALLEVGTAFHPDLSGRENIFLNGAILGMEPAEIRSKLDEIIAFSGVEAFLDMPLRRYSSGMQARLGFAVAAHLDPDVLIVDEVLAVGDAEFQQRCLGKMKDVASHGRTVLFVSHNLGAVRQLCNRVLWLSQGQVVEDTTDVEGAVRRYLLGDSSDTHAVWPARALEPDQPAALATDEVDVHSLMVLGPDGQPVLPGVSRDQPLTVAIDCTIKSEPKLLKLGFGVFTLDGSAVFESLCTDQHPADWPRLGIGRQTLMCHLPGLLLNEGVYVLALHVSLHNVRWISDPSTTPIKVRLTISGGLSQSPYWITPREGAVAPVLPWTLKHPFAS